MYIEKIHIDTFGKLSDRDFELSEGINIIEGANESGKSTLAAFIKFVFYGVTSREKSAVLSWQTGGAAGSITVCDGDKRYRIERALAGTREAVQLIDANTNLPIRHVLDGTTPGELFFGVGTDMFSATAFVSQLGGAVSGGAKVSDGIENILFSADESVNTQKAISKLDAMRVSLLHKNEKGGRLFELDRECAEAEVRLDTAKRGHDEILTKEAQLSDMREKYAAADEKARDISECVEQFEARRIAEMFTRSRGIEAKLEELRANIEEQTGTDVASVNKLEETIDTITLLEKEARLAKEAEDALPPIAEDAELDEYVENGGEAVLSAKIERSYSRAKICTISGVVSALVGLVLAVVGIMAKPLAVALIVGGAVLLALAAVLFVLGMRSRKVAGEIEERYDFDVLEARLAARNAAIEAAKLAEHTAITANRRCEEAYEVARTEYGCDFDGLVAELTEQKEKLKSIDKLKVEYDKYATVQREIRAQLSSYDEEQTRALIDERVDVSGVDADKLPELRREADFAAKMASSLEKHTVELEKTLAGLYPTVEEPTVAADRLSVLKAERETLTKRHAAYKLALEKMSEASDNLRESISPRLAKDTARLLSHITGGKYKEIGVGTELELCVETENGTKDIDVLSAGTQDAAYLCLRLALISLLYRKSMPPVIYDEAFSRQDDTRLAAMMKIASLSAQSIVFTSNSREAIAMQTLGEFKHIIL